MSKYDDLRPEEGELTYPEYDAEFECFGVFGYSSGFCYRQYQTYEGAAISSKEINKTIDPLWDCVSSRID